MDGFGETPAHGLGFRTMLFKFMTAMPGLLTALIERVYLPALSMERVPSIWVLKAVQEPVSSTLPLSCRSATATTNSLPPVFF